MQWFLGSSGSPIACVEIEHSKRNHSTQCPRVHCEESMQYSTRETAFLPRYSLPGLLDKLGTPLGHHVDGCHGVGGRYLGKDAGICYSEGCESVDGEAVGADEDRRCLCPKPLDRTPVTI